MNNYFTISEFAKLRNININSLRYYERLGILKPAYIDERTGYRYYSAEQLTFLDKIIMCINLGIPLKELTEYVDGDGNLQSRRLLERGREVARERICEIERNMSLIEYSLKSLESSREFVDRQGVYVRKLESRRVITSGYFTGPVVVKNLMFEVAKLYKFAQENQFSPLLPAGQLLHFQPGKEMRYCLFLEIVDQTTPHQNIVILPGGEYSCMQIDLNESVNLPELVYENWGENEEITVIIHNIILEKYSYGSRPSELQKRNDGDVIWPTTASLKR